MNKADLALLISAAKAAGKIARDFYNAGEVKTWDKDKNHPVTEADIAVNDYLLTTLQTARADYGWLSEETKDDFSSRRSKRSFVVDPIDGTRAFIDRNPHFTICLAVIENGVSVAGVVYNPLTEEMFEAVSGGGARLNGSKISPSICSTVQNCTMIGYPRKFRRLGWPDMDVCIRNSMAYRIVMVAAGLRDAAVSFTPKSDWDLAAASLIASEAGGICTDLEGASFNYAKQGTKNNGVICAGPALHPLLLEQVGAKLPSNTKSLETKMSDRKQETPSQLLHIVIGGELVDPMKTEFIDLEKMIYIGAYPNYKTAYNAWKSAAQTTVDNAHMRFFILHAHDLIDPDNDGIIG